MPIYFKLYYSQEAEASLKSSPVLKSLIEAGKPVRNKTSFSLDVYDIALEESIYGDKNDLSLEDRNFFEKYEKERVILPKDLKVKTPFFSKNPQALNVFIGKFRVNFISWLKYVARQTKSEISLNYEHERGDNPYEWAYWKFNYQYGAIVKEAFGITDYDGGRWSSDVYIMNNGNIIKDFRRL